MLIKTLVENKSTNPKIKAQHGLSLYIEADNHKILFDLGGGNLFIKNAQKLGVDLKAVDTVIISHGHSDHGGALSKFLAVNNTATIYIQKNAFEQHSFKLCGFKFNVGLDASLKAKKQIVFVDSLVKITQNLVVFADVKDKTILTMSKISFLKRKTKWYWFQAVVTMA